MRWRGHLSDDGRMTLLEILVVAGAAALGPARWAPSRARRAVTWAAVAVFVPAGAALLVTGVRWQLVPILAGGLLAAPFAVSPLLRRRGGRPAWRAPRWLAVPGTAVCAGLVAAGVAAAWALPRPVFPAPSGPYAVGTTVLGWTDPDRPETATAEPDDRRAVVVQLWYPARPSPAGVERARYLGRTEREARAVARGLTGYLGVPGFLLDELPQARSHAVPGAPAADGGRWPVVVFSPGLGGVRTQNTAWAEELAGRGYVVAALDHPYDSAAVTLTGGRTVRTRVAATGDPAEDARRAAGWTAVRAADLSFVLTQLGRLDRGEIPDPPGPGTLTGRLDTGRAAATGHSIGGGAALQAAHQDPRFAAVINLDGYPHDPDPRPFHQPFLALTHPVDPGENQDYIPRLTRVLKLGTATGYHVIVRGAAHLTFTDAPLYLPPLPSLVGSRGRDGGPRLTVEATAVFLDATLRDRPVDVAAHLSRYGSLTVHRAGR